jgi:fructokinase
MKNFEVVALGELLIDFIQCGISEQGNVTMEANAGGAPCNVLAMLTKLGKQTAFIGKVGNDYFGNFLKDSVSSIGIDTSNLILDDTSNTTLAFVNKLPNGDREFSFYRNDTADTLLTKEDIQTEILENTKIFHFGTLSMTHESSKEATQYAVEVAKNHGAWISFDPNVRKNLWKSPEDIKTAMEYGLSKCDILKISDDEVEFFTGTDAYNVEVKKLQEKYNITIVFLTLGKSGSRVFYNGDIIEEKALVQSSVVDATGAGDTFFGCVLSKILEHGLVDLTPQTLHETLKFANTGASLITQKKGALKVMPSREDIYSWL